MKTTKIFFTTLSLGVLLTACWGSKHATSQKQSSGKADTTAITNVVRKDTATVDSLTWYAGPLPVFKSTEEFDSFLNRQKNIIRNAPLKDVNETERAYIKNEDGTTTTCVVDIRSLYHRRIPTDSIPVILKMKIQNVDYYYVMQNTNNTFDGSIQPTVIGYLCHSNNYNYYFPSDLNTLLSLNSSVTLSINEKIEIFISTFDGFQTKYEIINITPTKKELYDFTINYEAIFKIKDIIYHGYFAINHSNFTAIFISKEGENKYKIIGFDK
jgi:hypothetical protein